MSLTKAISSPGRLSVLAFVVLILLGTSLLVLPAASCREPLSFVDALFTATSASCVTGLIVVDTGKDLTLFGQLIVFGLIQVGGLGILTLSTVFLLLRGRRPTMAGRLTVQDSFTHSGDRNLGRLLLNIICFTLIIEAIGAGLLLAGFINGRGFAEALYLAIFHAVSAFCNAGFSLFSDSLMSYRTDPLVNLTVCFLIISGGIGFLVVAEIKKNFCFSRSIWSRLSLHSKLALSSAFFLIASGTLLFLIMEYDNTLSGLTFFKKVLASLFQSVTARTAGFNTLPVEQFANQTLFLIILYMFVGGSSGSCAGGIKTGTFATLVLLGLSRLRAHESPQIFRRSISQGTVERATSVAIVSAAVVVIAVLLIQVSELGGTAHVLTRGKFLELFFEVVSAFGTVGLSTGVTSQLSPASKLIIIAVMFTGRLGPLVVAVAVTRRKVVHYRYAEETIMIG